MRGNIEHFDCIVVGLGAMGSATAYQLAKRGVTVLGIDRFSPPHIYGSTHGETRITRQAIGEGEEYVPLVLRSNEIWRELERETGQTLLTQNGGLILASAGGESHLHGKPDFFGRTVSAAEKFGIKHEILEASEITKRFSPFHLQGDERGYYEPGAGFLNPEACVTAQLSLAEHHGATLHTGETVTAILPDLDKAGATVTTNRESYHAERLILTAGSWLPQLLEAPSLQIPQIQFPVYRQVLYWFEVNGDIEAFLPEKFPVFIWSHGGSSEGIYGFPALNGKAGGVKVATEQFIETVTPETVSREVTPSEIQRMYRENIADFLPSLSENCVSAVTCLYTVAPDSRFVLASHPAHPQIFVASPCSGHGFKHSAAIGEAIADWATQTPSSLDLSSFGFYPQINTENTD